MMRMIWLFAQFLGWLGAIFVCYSVIAAFTTSWPPIEEYAAFVSALLTITGAVVTAASIYLVRRTSPRPAWVTSRFVTAPVVICGGLLAIVALFRAGHISPVLVDGFSLLAVSGSLFRLLPYPDPESTNWRAFRSSYFQD